MARDFKTIGVVGLGTMGAGITEVFARNGYTVVGVEVDDDGVARGRQHLEHSTARAVSRGKLSEDEAKQLHDRVTFATSLQELKDADLVVEAVVESVEIKKEIFKQLDGIVAEDTILATNTSSLSVTEISTANAHPGRVIGVHFFNPAPVQGFVEIVRPWSPSRTCSRTSPRWCRRWARTPWCAATRRASSRTRCCSATSTTRSRCTRPATPPARTSTRRCGSAAATRWVRWPCST